MWSRQKKRLLFGAPLALWETLFFGLPFLFLVRMSLKKYELGAPGPGFTVANYGEVFTSTIFWRSLYTTTWVSTVIALGCTGVALAIVLCLSGLRNRFLTFLMLITCALVFFSGILPRAFSLVFLLSGNGPLFSGGDGLLYTRAGTLLGYFPIMLPLCIVVLLLARNEISSVYTDACADLGVSRSRTVLCVVIPLMKPGIAVCCILCFILCAGDVVVVDLIGGSRVYTTASYIIDFVKIDDWGSASAAATGFLCFSTVFLALSMKGLLRVLR